MILVDTDVLIWYMRGDIHARQAIDRTSSMAISIVTHMELVQGMRDKRELRALKRALELWRTAVLPITEEVSYRAMAFVEQHFHSHAVRVADALVGATACVHGIPILTGNTKHYDILEGVDVHVFRQKRAR